MRTLVRGALLAAALCVLESSPGFAQSGTVEIAFSARSSEHAVEMGDTVVTAGGGDGSLAFNRSSGRPFVEGAKAAFRYASFARKTPSGTDLEADGVATFSTEDTLLLLFEHHAQDAGSAEEGTLRLTGGTGRFAGIDGHCRYKMNNGGEQWNVTAKCEWLYSFPYR